MNGQNEDNRFSIVVTSDPFAAHTSRLKHPLYRTNSEEQKRRRAHLKAIGFSFDTAVTYHPSVLRDPAAFLRLAISHGYPAPKLALNDTNRQPRNVAFYVEETYRRIGSQLMKDWKRTAPLRLVSKLTQQSERAPTPKEPFAPGVLRKMQSAMMPIGDELGFQIIRNLNVLEDPFAFYKLCLSLGYEGPGSGLATDTPNDLNLTQGKRLIAAWRVHVIG